METEKLTTRIGKLLSGTRKPDEGFATIFVYEPKDFLEKQHGNLYFSIEVASGSESAAEVGETVINAIKEEFYQDLERSVVLSFESALRKANEELSDLASAGETDWIGKLNVACAVLSEGKLHLSKVGATEAYIIRGDKITHISEGLSQETEESDEKDQHPLKTFSTITSGSLQKGDKLVMSSPELFSHISLAGLKKIATENSPSSSVSKLKELLKDEEGIGSIGVLIIEITTEEALSKEARHEKDEIWIEEPKPAKAATESVVSFLSGIKKSSKNVLKSLKDKVMPAKTTPTEEPSIPETSKTEFPKTETKSHSAAEKKETFLSFAVDYFKKFSWGKFSKDIKRVFGSLKNSLKERTRSTYFKLFAVAVLLFLISLSLIIRNYYINKNVKEVKAKLDQAVSLEAKAEGALIYDARKEAKDYLNESKNLVEEVLKTKYYKKEALDLVSKINELSKKADGIFEVSPNLVWEFGNDLDVSNFVFLDKTLYFVNPKNNQLSFYNVDNKNQESFEISPSQATFSQITTFPSRKIILLLNDAPELFEFTIKNSKASKSSSQGEFKKGSAIATYSSNLYILAKEDNQIYRYSKLATSYSNPSNYITDKSVDVKNGVSLTIPGIVYVLKSDGEVVKLIKGKKQEFSLKDMPFSFKNPIKIRSIEGSTEIYILDKELGVLVFSVNGKYIKNITSGEFKDLKDFYIDEASGTIYVLSENKIYGFGK